MATAPTIDRFFELAEHLATDFSLIKDVSQSNRDRQRQEVEVALEGLVAHRTIEKTTKRLRLWASTPISGKPSNRPSKKIAPASRRS